MNKRKWIAIISVSVAMITIVILLSTVLSSCYIPPTTSPLPTPADSPLPTPVPGPEAFAEVFPAKPEAFAVSASHIITVSDAFGVWWDEYAAIRCGAPVARGDGTYVATCHISSTLFTNTDIYTGIVDSPDNYGVDYELFVDLEARDLDGAVLDATRFTTPYTGTTVIGTGQYDGAWRGNWILEVDGASVVEIYRRACWESEWLPNLCLLFERDGVIQSPDERGFVLIETKHLQEQYKYYLPQLGSSRADDGDDDH